MHSVNLSAQNHWSEGNFSLTVYIKINVVYFNSRHIFAISFMSNITRIMGFSLTFFSDDSKFGQRMLEKFGWSKGVGLGKNKQGIAENIKVQHKVTPTGIQLF